MIREATPKDAASIATIQQTSWVEAYKNIIPMKYLTLRSLEEGTAKWEEILTNSPFTHYIAFDKSNKAVGFVAFGTSLNENFPNHGELKAIYVLESAHGTGIGSQLHDIALNALKQSHERSILHVLQENQRALTFYQHKGWKILEEHACPFPGCPETFPSYTLIY